MDISLRTHSQYVGQHISSLPTPALVLSRPILERNIDCLLRNVRELGIPFRPHVKTLKSLEATRMMLSNGKHRSIVASTICEIEGSLLLVEEGILDECLYGFPVTESPLPRLYDLSKKIKISLMVDNEQQVDLLEKFEIEILEAILAQSCAHRAVRAPNVTDSEALSLYNKSLRSLRTALETISGQPKEDLLALIVSMLVLCFTETARGDTTGGIFFHLQATSSLLPGALIKLKGSLPKELRSFLLEYYLYTASLSMISMDTGIQSHTVVCSQLLHEGYELVETGYIGNLCGCWLELILFIPQVFDLGSQWLTQFQDDTAERIMAFSLLQSQISNWKPSEHVHPDVALVGKVYQQAMLLYLLSVLGDPRADENSLHSAKIQEATSQAMLYLEHLPATKQINTSLCWPLAVVGSCALHQQQQEQIRNRLDVMTKTIGLGNISKTKDILDYVWSQDLKGPWKISKAMQASGIWISFA